MCLHMCLNICTHHLFTHQIFSVRFPSYDNNIGGNEREKFSGPKKWTDLGSRFQIIVGKKRDEGKRVILNEMKRDK